MLSNPDAPTNMAPSRQLLWGFSALSASLSAGYGVLFTIVGDYRDVYGISAESIGWIIGIGFFAGFLSQMLIAPIGDRGFARRLVLIGVVVNALGLVLMGVGDDTPTIMAGRIISGLAIGSATPAIRRIIVVGDPTNLGRNLGRLIAADVFGFALGPAVSAVLVGPFGLAAPFFVIAAVSLILVALTLRIKVNESIGSTRRRLAIDLLRIRSFAGAVVLGGTTFVMIGAFDALWDLVHTDLGTANWMANLGISLFAVPLIILGPFGGKLAQRTGPFRLAAAGLLGAAGFMAAYGFLPSGGWIFAFAMGHSLVDGLTIAASGVAVGMTIPDDRQAGAQGVLGAAQALMAGIAAVVTGILYENSGRTAAYVTAAVAMVVLVGVGMALASTTWRQPLAEREPVR